MQEFALKQSTSNQSTFFSRQKCTPMKSYWQKSGQECSCCQTLIFQLRMAMEAEGQKISECPYEIIVYPKIATKKFLRFRLSL